MSHKVICFNLFFLTFHISAAVYGTLQENALKKVEIKELEAKNTFLHMANIAIGADPDVKIPKDLTVDNQIIFKLRVADPSKEQALATLLTQTVLCEGDKISIVWHDAHDNPITPEPLPLTIEAAKAMFAKALKGNRYYMGLVHGNEEYAFFVELRACYVQYFADDRSSMNGTCNRTAEDVFTELFQVAKIRQGNVLMGITTEPYELKSGCCWGIFSRWFANCTALAADLVVAPDDLAEYDRFVFFGIDE